MFCRASRQSCAAAVEERDRGCENRLPESFLLIVERDTFLKATFDKTLRIFRAAGKVNRLAHAPLLALDYQTIDHVQGGSRPTQDLTRNLARQLTKP